MDVDFWLKCLNLSAVIGLSLSVAQPLFNEASNRYTTLKSVEINSIAAPPVGENSSTNKNINAVNVEINSTTNSVANPGLFSNDSNDSAVDRLMNRLHAFVKDPVVHSVVLPAMVGVCFAILTMIIVCCIRSCVRSHVRKKRKQRIRHLADELKTDRSMLLADSSDDEF